MNPEVKEQWIIALESGNYHQGRNALHKIDSENGAESFCCLGVLCDLAHRAGAVTREDTGILCRYGKENAAAYLPSEVMEWAGLMTNDPRVGRPPEYNIPDDDDQSSDLSYLNDVFTLSFTEIAQLIRSNL